MSFGRPGGEQGGESFEAPVYELSSANELEMGPEQMLAMDVRFGLEKAFGTLAQLREEQCAQAGKVSHTVRELTYSGWSFSDTEQNVPLDTEPAHPEPLIDYSVEILKANKKDLGADVDVYKVVYKRSVRGEPEETSVKNEILFLYDDEHFVDYHLHGDVFTNKEGVVYPMPDHEMYLDEESFEEPEEDFLGPDEDPELYDEDPDEYEEPLFEEVVSTVSNEDGEALLRFSNFIDRLNGVLDSFYAQSPKRKV